MKRERERERRGTDFSIDWLTSTRRQLDKLAVRIQSERFQIERGRESEAVESHCATTHSWDQKIDLAVTVSAHFSPPRIWLALWALNMCLQREFSEQGYHRRLCVDADRLIWVITTRSAEPGLCCQVEKKSLLCASYLCGCWSFQKEEKKKIVFLCEYQANMGFPWIYNLLRQFFFKTVHNVKVWDSDSLSVRGSLLWGTFHNRGHKVILT